MQQQQQPQAPHPLQAIPPSSVTTEIIQKFLDENKQLILAILDHQNLGKLAECGQYQTRLQQNLMYLAAIADAQPQQPPPHPQMPPQHAGMQQGAHYMQPPQAMTSPLMATRAPVQFNQLQMQDHHQQQQLQQLHHQQSLQGHHVGLRSSGPNNGMHVMHAEATLAPQSTPALVDFGRGGASSGSLDAMHASRGNKQDGGTGPENGGPGDGRGGSTVGHGVDAEPSYLRGSEEDAN